MKIIQQRFLRGANLHSLRPCVQTTIDLRQWHERSSAELPFLQSRLLGLMPTLRKQPRAGGRPGGFAERLEQGAHLADVLLHVAVELQRLAGNQVVFSQVNEVRAASGHYQLVCAYDSERVAAAATRMALELTLALAEQADFDYAGRLAGLRQLAQRCAVGAACRMAVAAARRRGIPAYRISEDAELFQLGWGSKRRLLHPNTTGADVAAMFDDGDGRIPLIAVTGTNGKTTTTRLIAHTVGASGVRTGMANSEGVYIDGVPIDEGDCTGYHSARLLLNSPNVDYAVLETARGGVLRRGLAFDRCDVSVLLNVSEDHLGMDGVETLAQLARVKQVVADAAGKAVVLNAEDEWCVAIGRQLRPEVERLYFALDPEHPQLVRHLEQGGRAVYLQNSMMILADGARHQALLDVRGMPVTLNGVARCHVANVLAAGAALAAAGFSPQQICAGLASFVAQRGSSVLRSKIVDINGVSVLVDYAHNAAAYAAAAAMARGISSGKVVGVVSLPGDRRDEDLLKVGAVCAAGFDDVVIYEVDNRGRTQGETARLLTCGVRSAEGSKGRVHCKLDAQRAIRFGLGMCKPGDVLAIGCGASLNDLIDALHLDQPAVAERLSSENSLPA